MANDLDHIRWARLPETASSPKGNSNPNAPKPPLRVELSQHGQGLKQLTEGVLQDGIQKREALGIDPRHLLILEFTFLNVNQREVLEERFGIQIVEESPTEDIVEGDSYKIQVRFIASEALDEFIKSEDWPKGFVDAKRVRASNGSVDMTTLDLHFENRELAKNFIEQSDARVQSGFTVRSKEPAKVSSPRTQLLAQFPNANVLTQFQRELELYRTGSTARGVLPLGLRRNLFDALEGVDRLSSEDRRGNRLREEGLVEDKEEFYFDVDLWHPGRGVPLRDAINQFREAVSNGGGRVTDPPTTVAETLLLARVQGGRATLEALLEYDNVVRVDLPPRLESFEFSIFDQIDVPEAIDNLPNDAPLACVIDSGVVAGPPLLSGLVVDERDFDSGENTTVDLTGHGTHVAGIVAYGDIRQCLEGNRWEPKVRLLSGKVMRSDSFGGAEFADAKRAETQIREAIEYFVKEYDCRIFNLSLGDSTRLYEGRRQLPMALMIDELARNLDIVVVIAAGNVSTPNVPEDTTTADTFQKTLREQLFSEEHSVIDPASAVNALTVGAISRTDIAFNRGNLGRRVLAASPSNAPSPFTRTSMDGKGRGIQSVVKPDLVAYGGNYSLSMGMWTRNDPSLAEPSLKYDFQADGRLLNMSCGTSVAAPHVTHISALVEEKLRRLLNGGKPSANLIRALVVHSARIPEETASWIGEGCSEPDTEARLLRVVGYGKPDVERALFSTDNRAVLYAEDEIADNSFQLYALELPDSFITTNGKRQLRVTLAYDPPVRGTRLEYTGRVMFFQIYRGVESQTLLDNIAGVQSLGVPIQKLAGHRIDARPPYTSLQQSTVQSAVFEGVRATKFNYPVGSDGRVLWHVLVGCNHRFAADDSTKQKYALVVSLEHGDDTVEIYQTVRQRVQQRVRV